MSTWKDWLLYVLLPLLVAGGAGAALGTLLSSRSMPSPRGWWRARPRR